jgi:uncharacterized protein (TIGR02147 family)
LAPLVLYFALEAQGRIALVPKEMAFSVYDYSEFPKLVEGLKAHYPGRKKPMSFEQLAKKIGYTSPRIFSMVINRQRLPSTHLVAKISAALNLDTEEQSYVDLLRMKEKLSFESGFRAVVSQSISRQASAIERTYTPPERLELEQFAQVSEWYFPVLKQLIGGSSGRATLEYLANKMRSSLSEGELLGALRHLVELGVVYQAGDTYHLKKNNRSLEVGNTVPSLAIKRHHAQAMQCAVNSLYKTPMEQREFQSLVIGVAEEDSEDAKKFIRSFVQSFRRKFGHEGSDRICRLNVQFFVHTDS